MNTIPPIKSLKERKADIQRIQKNFPRELQGYGQFVLWRYVAKPKRKKLTKLPCTSANTDASTTDPSTWCNFQTAADTYIQQSAFHGIGFVFTADDPYFGIDLDDCRNPQNSIIEPWAQVILNRFGTYTELSPSATGLHIIGKGKLPPNGRRKGDIEVYESGRYFTITGECLPGADNSVNDVQAELTKWHQSVFGATQKNGSRHVRTPKPTSHITTDQSDDEVIVSIRRSNDAALFGELFTGNWSDKYPSQSEADLALAGIIARYAGSNAVQVDRIFRISGLMREKWDEQRGVQTYGEMTVAKALHSSNNADDSLTNLVERLNQKYAVITNGNSVRILAESTNADGNIAIRLLSQSDFELRTKNVPAPTGFRSAATAWLKNPLRREYDGLIFVPGNTKAQYYNLWRGFSCRPVKGDCSLYWRLVKDAVCAGNDEIYTYLRRYMAHIIQRPDERPEISIVLRGGQGTGKNTFVDQLGALMQPHFLQVNSVDQLTGRFNAHLMNVVILHANEATWGGNRSESGKLKAMITDQSIPIEIKGQDIVHIANFLRLIISSNEAWPIPVEADDRRFLILDVAPVFKQDQQFFGALHHQMDNGGREALMYDLLHEDVSDYVPRNKPTSPFGADMKIRSADTVTQWLFDRLSGNIISAQYGACMLDFFEQPDKSQEYNKQEIFEDYQRWERTARERFALGREQFFRRLRELLQASMREKRPSGKMAGNRPRILVFNGLHECRRAFEKAAGLVGMLQWDEA